MSTKLNYNLKEKDKEETLIILTTTYLGTRIRVSTQKKVLVAAFNVDKQRCVISSDFSDRQNREFKKINRYLDTIEDEIMKIINDRDFQFRYTTADNLKKTINTIINKVNNKEEAEEKEQAITPSSFFNQFINNLKFTKDGLSVANNTIASYNIALDRFNDYLNKQCIVDSFEVFNENFEENFRNFLYKKNLKYNTVNQYIKVLKIMLKSAHKKGLLSSYHFQDFKTSGKETDNVYLTRSEIEKIYCLDVSSLITRSSSRVELIRDMFVLSCQLGIRFIDLVNLNTNANFDFTHNIVTITTQKTKEVVVIPLSNITKEICQKYNNKFVFVSQMHANKILPKIAELAKINEIVIINELRGGKQITKKVEKFNLIKCHTARRSFATNLYLQGAQSISIMKLTGHRTESAFLKYIKITKTENAELLQKYFE